MWQIQEEAQLNHARYHERINCTYRRPVGTLTSMPAEHIDISSAPPDATGAAERLRLAATFHPGDDASTRRR